MKLKTLLSKILAPVGVKVTNPLDQPIIALRDGWIPFTAAQPEFDVPVLVRFHPDREGRPWCGIGVRTREVCPEDKQEKWDVAVLGRPRGAMYAWRPI